MQKLNLCNKEKSDIDYSISKFPDGEVQITLGEINRKDYVEVHCRITNAEELFILTQIADILNRQGILWVLNIYYLMGMRMDRVMDFNRPFTLKVVSDIIGGLNYHLCSVLAPHSGRTIALLNAEMLHPIGEYTKLEPEHWEVYNKYLVVYPDKGAYERYHRNDTLVAEKVRNVDTGQIESIKIVNPEILKKDKRPLMVVDDLCDAGGTFVGLAKEIRKYTDRELNVFVTHMVNPRGIENLSRNYDHVYFTNSYENWEKYVIDFPKNCTQIDVI